MKAGEFILFSSLNTHGSNPNVTSDDTRLAFAGRYTTNDVVVYKDMATDRFPTPEGFITFDTDRIGCIQAQGRDTFGHNRILERPERAPA
jgi:ectoine hydroxylase-related dioxygenase (phytanoyl-CoA dioxygenase family)